jgi:hypothetical protein
VSAAARNLIGVSNFPGIGRSFFTSAALDRKVAFERTYSFHPFRRDRLSRFDAGDQLQGDGGKEIQSPPDPGLR